MSSTRQTMRVIRRAEAVADGVCFGAIMLIVGAFIYASTRIGMREHALEAYGGEVLARHPSARECGPGLLLPLDATREESWPNLLRAALYLVGLLYCFAGVAIVADIFMQAIETITSQTRLVDGAPVKVWNDTVANLTLMALGSSAPEILLSIIELLGNSFYSGELGPSTIVGSAAFNLFVILAVCVSALPKGEKRTLEFPYVFYTTAVASILAYCWLIVILSVSSPNAIVIWEGVVTFAAFPVLVLIAYRVDRSGAAAAEKAAGGFERLEEAPAGADAEAPPDPLRKSLTRYKTSFHKLLLDKADMEAVRAEQAGIETIARIMRKLGLNPREASPQRLAVLIASHVLDSTGKSRATRRIEAVRALTGGARAPRARASTGPTLLSAQPAPAGVRFSAGVYAVLERDREVVITLVRPRASIGRPDEVRVLSSDGTASAVADYDPVDQVVHFSAGESKRELRVRVIEDTHSEGNETFFLSVLRPLYLDSLEPPPRDRLARRSLRVSRGTAAEMAAAGGGGGGQAAKRMSRAGASAAAAVMTGAVGGEGAAPTPPTTAPPGYALASTATVVITDVEGKGSFKFERAHYRVHECDSAEIAVVRVDGCMGDVTVRYHSRGGAGRALLQEMGGTLRFAHGELVKSVSVRPLNTLSVDGRSDAFTVVLSRDDEPEFRMESTVEIVDDPTLRPRCAEVLGMMPAKMDELRALIGPSAEYSRAYDDASGPAPTGRASLSAAEAAAGIAPPRLGLGAAWRMQLEDAITVHGADDFDAEGEGEGEGEGDEPGAEAAEDVGADGTTGTITVGDRVGHLIALPWKVLFAVLIPPASWLGGWACFVLALSVIGMVTAVIGDLASILGCTVSLSDEVTAITLVALGTSLPDTFASRAATLADEHADNAIGNVTGSNAVNVLLGLGMPWLLGAIYWVVTGATDEWKERVGADMVELYPHGAFIVRAGSLGYSVTVFSTGAVLCLATVTVRALRGYALGGPLSTLTSVFFVMLWLAYISLSILNSTKAAAEAE